MLGTLIFEHGLEWLILFLFLPRSILPENEVVDPGALQLDLPALHEHPRDVRAVVEVRALLPLAVPPLGQRVPEDDAQQPVREPVHQPHELEPHVVQHRGVVVVGRGGPLVRLEIERQNQTFGIGTGSR